MFQEQDPSQSHSIGSQPQNNFWSQHSEPQPYYNNSVPKMGINNMVGISQMSNPHSSSQVQNPGSFQHPGSQDKHSLFGLRAESNQQNQQGPIQYSQPGIEPFTVRFQGLENESQNFYYPISQSNRNGQAQHSLVQSNATQYLNQAPMLVPQGLVHENRSMYNANSVWESMVPFNIQNQVPIHTLIPNPYEQVPPNQIAQIDGIQPQNIYSPFQAQSVTTRINGQTFNCNFRNKIQRGFTLHCDVTVANLIHRCLLDTGATVSAINPNTLQLVSAAIHRQYKVQPIVPKLSVETTQKTILDEKVELVFTLNGKSCFWSFYIVPDLTESFVLGLDWMLSHKFQLSCNEETINISFLSKFHTPESSYSMDVNITPSENGNKEAKTTINAKEEALDVNVDSCNYSSNSHTTKSNSS